MAPVFGDSRTIPASEDAKKHMKQLVTKGLFAEQRDVWMIGAALGISLGKTREGGGRDTFQNINILNPEGVFAAPIIRLYPEMSPEDRLKRLVDHAEWGIQEVYRKYRNGTLDGTTLGSLAAE